MKKLINYLSWLALLGLLVFLMNSCTSNQDVKPKITNNTQIAGGNVFYILQAGDKGYIQGETHGYVYKELKGKYVWWGCGAVGINPSILSPILGEGINNTNTILILCPKYNAASACKSDGWWLPNTQEMNKLFLSKLISTTNTYWISEGNSNYGKTFRLLDGLQNNNPAIDSLYVVGIKSF